MSALRTSRLYRPGNIPGTHLCERLSQPQGHSAAGRVMSMKNSNDTTGNRTHDLQVRSAVPQPTASPGAPKVFYTLCLCYRQIDCRRQHLHDTATLYVCVMFAVELSSGPCKRTPPIFTYINWHLKIQTTCVIKHTNNFVLSDTIRYYLFV